MQTFIIIIMIINILQTISSLVSMQFVFLNANELKLTSK